MRTYLEILLSKGKRTEKGCLEWQGYRMPHGYGQKRYKGKTRLVHRIVASIVHNFDINNSSVIVRHKCDNPPCFDPEHVIPGTQSDNMFDRGKSPRRRREFCDRGHKLTEDNIHINVTNGAHTCRICYIRRYRKYNASRSKANL